MNPCQCRCGGEAPFYKKTDKSKGYVKGNPARFISGHWAKTAEGRKDAASRSGEKHSNWGNVYSLVGRDHPKWKETVSYPRLHSWMNKTYPRVGSCEECGNSPTEYANISKQYLRERSDWKELCRPCHRAFDGARGEEHHNAKLTKKDVQYIRKIWKTGKHPSKTKLALTFGVSRGLIGHIIHNRAWRGV